MGGFPSFNDEARKREKEYRDLNPVMVTWVLPAHLCEGAVGESPVYILGFPGQPVPAVGHKLIGPDDMGMVEVKDIIWDYGGGFYPLPRAVQVICEEVKSE